jgi:hypothetical protein
MSVVNLKVLLWTPKNMTDFIKEDKFLSNSMATNNAYHQCLSGTPTNLDATN